MKTCRYCPAPANKHPQAVTCGSAECKKAHHVARCREHQRQRRAEAAARGESYRGRWERVSYSRTSRRRAVAACAAWEPIDRDVLGDRDGWVCGLCKLPVDRDLAYPAPLSASIDHVVPLKLGGGHTWDNVQIAHNRCNVTKKANTAWKPEEVA